MLKHFLFFVLLTLSSSASVTSVVLKDNTSVYDSFQLSYFKDINSTSQIEEIATLPFHNENSNQFTFGYFKGTLWLKIPVKNESKEHDFILSINEHFYEIANIYYFNEGWKKIENGVFKPLKERSVQSSKLAFELNIPPNTTQTLYVELQGQYSYFGNISLYQKEYFFKHQLLSIESFFIFLLGIVLIIILFNLFLFLKLQERIYFYYVGYTFFALIYLMNISGLLAYFDLQFHMYRIQISASFSMIFLALFSLEYLNVKENLNYASYFIKLILFLLLLLSCLLMFSYTPWNKFLNHTISVLNITLIITALIIYIKGESYVKYYLFAIMLFFLSVITFTLMLSGVLEYSNITRYGYVYAMGIEVALFSLLLADRYNIIKNKQIQTQNQLIDLQNNHTKTLENEIFKQTQNLHLINTQLSGLLKERELLLKEAFHRVKNNFHMITAFLWFESKKEGNENRFSELINRIKSMSLIHEYLCNSKDLSHINTQEYLEEMLQAIVQTYHNSKVSIQTNVEKIRLEFDTIMSLGIILNEIISNSIKHHPKAQSIVLKLSCFKKNRRVVVQIQDNGKGFDCDEQNMGFGLRLIKDFAKKLPNGSYAFYQKEGTLFELIFDSKENNES